MTVPDFMLAMCGTFIKIRDVLEFRIVQIQMPIVVDVIEVFANPIYGLALFVLHSQGHGRGDSTKLC